MKWWPWWSPHRHGNGDAARQANVNAEASLRDAEDLGDIVARTERTAAELTQRARRYTREFERSLNQRRRREERGGA